MGLPAAEAKSDVHIGLSDIELIGIEVRADPDALVGVFTTGRISEDVQG